MTKTNLTSINSPQLTRELYLQSAVMRKTTSNAQSFAQRRYNHWLI